MVIFETETLLKRKPTYLKPFYRDELYALITNHLEQWWINGVGISSPSGRFLYRSLLNNYNILNISVNKGIAVKVNNMRRLISDVLTPTRLYSVNAEELLVLTAAAESLGGQYIYQTRGPARGMFQMEPATEHDLLVNYIRYKPELRDILKSFIQFNADGTYLYRINDPLTYSLDYQVIMARIHYLRKPGALPHFTNVSELANYWKRHYNTHLGKGTPEGAIKKYKEYVG
jgi:hypothetical protein